MGQKSIGVVVSRSAAVFIIVLGLAACPDDGPTTCSYNGDTISVGAEFLADDGCNMCTCESDGTLSCTELVCGDGDEDGDANGDSSSDAGSNNNTSGSDGGPQGDGDGDGDGDEDGDGDGDGGPCVDNDHDGFYTCIDEDYPNRPDEIDCDDTRWYVQPGGWEYPDNGIDDNCDGLIDAEERPPCSCASDGSSSGSAIMGAMDLCDETIASISTEGDPAQFAVFQSYYGDVLPHKGDCLAVLSSGNADGTDVTGQSFCDTFGFEDCSSPDPDPNSTGEEVVNDLAQLVVTLTPPSNVKGFEFDFMFVSTEWPEFLCTQYNDTFYTLTETLAVQDGDRANISFDPQIRPITVNVGFFEQPREWSTSLANTPYGAEEEWGGYCTSFPIEDCSLPAYCHNPPEGSLSYEGSGSGWLTTRAPIDADDETVLVIFSIHDEGDHILDSSVFLDNFRWTPYEPPVSTTKAP